MWLHYATFIYTSWRSHYLSLLIAWFILSDCLPSPSLQADSISLLPAWEINERKQTIIRELQLLVTVKSVLKTFLFCLLYSLGKDTKKNKGNLRKVLCLLGCTPRFARAYAWKKIRVVTPALLERERERERVQNYLELPNNLPSFSYLFLLKNQMYKQRPLYLYYIGQRTV